MGLPYTYVESGGFIAGCLLLGAGLGIIWRLVRT